jgi:hypothetical protein
MEVYLQFFTPLQGMTRNSAERQFNFTFYVMLEVLSDAELANFSVEVS